MLPSPVGLYNAPTDSHHWVRFPTNERPVYDTKQSDGEVLAMLELWGMQSAPSLTSFPGPLWLRMVAPDRVLSIGQIEVN